MRLTTAVDYEKLVSGGESQTIVNISVNATDMGKTPLIGATVVRLFIRVTLMFQCAHVQLIQSLYEKSC